MPASHPRRKSVPDHEGRPLRPIAPPKENDMTPLSDNLLASASNPLPFLAQLNPQLTSDLVSVTVTAVVVAVLLVLFRTGFGPGTGRTLLRR